MDLGQQRPGPARHRHDRQPDPARPGARAERGRWRSRPATTSRWRCWRAAGQDLGHRSLDGQLGDGTTAQRRSPVPVIGVNDAVAHRRRAGHGLRRPRERHGAWRGAATTRASWATEPRPDAVTRWGRRPGRRRGGGRRARPRPRRADRRGRCGPGAPTTTASSATAPPPTGGPRSWSPTGVTQVIAGAHHSYALRSTGQVLSWGRNYRANLGDGTTKQPYTAGDGAAGWTGAVSIGSGRDFGMAVLDTGRVRTWGHNAFGQLGDGTTTNRTSSVLVPGVTGAVLAAGGGAEYAVVLVGFGLTRGLVRAGRPSAAAPRYRSPMTRVHAFGDDALGDLDAVGLVSRDPGRGSRVPEVVEAAIARVERVDPRLGAVAQPGSSVPGWRPPAHGTGTSRASRRSSRTTSTSRGCRPSRAATPTGPVRPATATSPGCSWRPDRCRSARPGCGSSASARPPSTPARGGPLAVGPRPHGRCLLGRLGRPGRRRRRTPGARERRRRLDPDPGRGQRAGRAQADPGPAGPGQDDAARCRCGSSPTGSSPGRCATPRRSSARRRRSTGACGCRRSGTSPAPGQARLEVAVRPRGVGTAASPEVAELTLKTAGLLEGLGHRVRGGRAPAPARCQDDFLLYWSLLEPVHRALRAPQLPRVLGPDARLDNLTLGLARHCPPEPAPAAARHRPAAAARAALRSTLYRGSRRHADADARHPDAAVGHLDPTQDYDPMMGRMLEWVAFTPLQNVTGDPAI